LPLIFARENGYYGSYRGELNKATDLPVLGCVFYRSARATVKERSTATTDRKRAQKIADEYEVAARRKRTALQVRRDIPQLHHEITSDEVSQTSLRNFLDS